jgi:hypothetical protein
MKGVQMLTMPSAMRTPMRQMRPLATRRGLDVSLGLENQPAGPQKAVAQQQRDAGEHCEWGQKIKRSASELPTTDPKSLDEGAEHQALREGGNARAVAEGVIPKGLILGVAKTEFKGNAAKDERQQHHQKREIYRRDDDGKSERKGGQEPEASENQPGLVAVPDWRSCP